MKEAKLTAQIDRWCTMNDPQLEEPLLLSSNESLSDNELLKISPELANQTVSGASLVISNMTDFTTQENEAKEMLGNCEKTSELTSKKYENLVKIMQELPEIGCTTVTDMARASAGYNPFEAKSEVRMEKYLDYTRRLMECPFFNLQKSETNNYHRGTKNWDKAVNDLVELYEGVEGENKAQIKKSITQMASSAASLLKQKQTKTLYTQSTIQSNDKKEITLWLYNATIDMVDTDKKGAESKQTDISISRVILKFYTQLWPTYTERVISKHIQWTDKWLDTNTTPAGSKKVNLTCLEGASSSTLTSTST